ncbi:hypothetical protein [Bacillus phage SWEP1]|nr:hypothetical protein [Bacillus phage SWEP1]UNA01611.1 hypothetical protein MG295_00194 [Bacillus phage vB_BcgM]
MSEPTYKVKREVMNTVQIFDPILFNEGSPVIMQSYTSDWERMYWREEHGIVKKYTADVLDVLVANYNGGEPEVRTIRANYIDDQFNIIPTKELLKELREELDAK